MVHTLALNIPRLEISDPCTLFARTCRMFNRKALVVYRTAWMMDSDELFEEVLEFIKTHRFRVVRKGMIVDVDMIFGKGEWTLYIESSGYRDGEPSALVDPMLVDEMRDEAIRMAKQMVESTN